ncbi:MAG: nitroreductase [Pseudomonadota bacterium]
MDLFDAVKHRRSVRAFKQEPVDQDLLEQIFQEAQDSPSNCNTQPWHVSVVSGEIRDELEKRMVADVMSGQAPSPYFRPGDQGLENEFRKRQVDCAISLYDAVGIKFEEKDKRQLQMLENWRFFGAPHGAFISMPKQFGETNAVDVGIYVQTLMLLMKAHGIGCCAQGALARFAGPVYELLELPENHAILVGLSFGYADEDHPINHYDVGRGAVEKAVTFYT